jgi:hypothetical protein
MLSFAQGGTSRQPGPGTMNAETGTRAPLPGQAAKIPARAARVLATQKEPASETEVARQLHALEYIASALRGIDESLAAQAKAAQNTMRLYGEVVKLLAQLEIRAAARW